MFILGPDLSGVWHLGFRVEDVAIVIMVLISLGPVIRGNPGVIIGLLAMFLVAVSSGVANALFQGTALTSASRATLGRTSVLAEMLRPVKYLLVYVGFSAVNSRYRPRIGTVIVGVALLAVAIQLLQLGNVFQVNDWLQRIYGKEVFYKAAERGYLAMGSWRGGSTFGNPNVYGTFLLMPLAVALVQVLFCCSEQRKRAWRIVWWGSLSVVFLFSLALTQSRSAGLAGIVLIALVVLYMAQHIGIGRRRVIVLGLVGLLLAFGLYVMVHIFGFSRLLGAPQDVIKRVSRLTPATTAALGTSPIFGLSAEAPITVDSEWGYVVYYFGLAGLLAYLFLLRAVFKSLPEGDVYGVSLKAVTLSFMVVALAAGVFLNNRIYPIFLALLGSYHSELYARRTDRKARRLRSGATGARERL